MLKLRLPLPVFRNAGEIVNGKNARMALKGITANRVALVISTTFEDSTYFEQILRLINSESTRVIKKTWAGEPSLSSVSTLVHEFEEFRPDYILALGGGSVIDGAKLAWLLYEHPLTSAATLFKPFTSPPLRGRAKFGAIPTTIGSGSEVSSAAVLLHDDNISKQAIVTHDFLPDLVILDPELVAEVPLRILKSTVSDALSHAVEGYVSQIKHPLMDIFAEKAVQLIFKNRSYFGDDAWGIEVIEELQYAAMLAGLVQNHCMVGLSHAIAHQLGNFKIAHGLANGLLMPAIIDFNSSEKVVKNKYENLCINAGVSGIAGLKGLFMSLTSGAKPSLVFSGDQLAAIGDLAVFDSGGQANPVPFSSSDVRELIKICL